MGAFACQLLILLAPAPAAAQSPIEIPSATLEDKLRGGLLGEMLGDLNGLAHEMKYIDQPGNVSAYTPALPDGAWTDDDTDIEWIYVLKMQSSREMLLAPRNIADEWTKHINRRIWCSHLYLRQLLDLGILPPLTGSPVLNPWADFNLSGQFVSETWGLISPGMPQTAARMAAYYTHVSVDGEPVQAAQLFASMIASAYVTSDIDRILDAGTAALDKKSTMFRIVQDVRGWHKQHPADWRATRKLIQDRYSHFGGHDMRDRNGVELNGASTVAALLYGKGDFVETVRHAFNFGWDADNNAATSGTIVGVTKGARWFAARRWNIKDQFRNTSRDQMPYDETITTFGDRMIALTAQVIRDHGGSRRGAVYSIRTEPAANVEALRDPASQRAELKARLLPEIAQSIAKSDDPQTLARAAYLAICLDEAPSLKAKNPSRWVLALLALKAYPNLLQVMFYESPIPAGERIREKAIAAGVVRPEKIKIW